MKFQNPKISSIFEKALLLSIICDKCDSEYEKIFQEESIEIIKILGLINNVYKYQINI